VAWSDGETSAEAAQVEVKAWFRGIAGKRGWSSTQLSAALALADEAYEAADDAEWFGASVRVFWEQMARGVQRPEFRGYPEWSNIADTVRQMLVTVDSVEQYQFDTSWYGSIVGGAAAAATSVAEAGGNVIEKTTNPRWVWGVAVGLVALAVLVKMPRRV
jgi:hypothetical protein